MTPHHPDELDPTEPGFTPLLAPVRPRPAAERQPARRRSPGRPRAARGTPEPAAGPSGAQEREGEDRDPEPAEPRGRRQ